MRIKVLEKVRHILFYWYLCLKADVGYSKDCMRCDMK